MFRAGLGAAEKRVACRPGLAGRGSEASVARSFCPVSLRLRESGRARETEGVCAGESPRPHHHRLGSPSVPQPLLHPMARSEPDGT